MPVTGSFLRTSTTPDLMMYIDTPGAPSRTMTSEGGNSATFRQVLFPAENACGIAFLLRFFDPALGLVKHGEAGMGEDVVRVDFDKLFGRRNRHVHMPTIEESHTETV